MNWSKLTSEVILDALRYGLDEGRQRDMPLCVALADSGAQLIGLIKDPDALLVTGELAIRKATFSAAWRDDTSTRFDRWQEPDRLLYGIAIAGISSPLGVFFGPGGVAVKAERDGRSELVCAVGVSGASPFSVDHDIAVLIADRIRAALDRRT